jgi:predicted RND superfamily exporter protein
MHILVIFLVLGVGADDVFVFVDKWKLTNEKLPLDMRLHETIDHALQAVFNTSFTTIIAFVATAISPIMPIAAFGIFAALAIFVNVSSLDSILGWMCYIEINYACNL